MRVLVIEDEREVVETVVAAVSAAGVALEVTHVLSRDEALSLLDGSRHFDLVIMDLNVPSIPGALDASPDFGREVYAAVRADMPGTLVWVFSAYANDEFVEEIIEEARQGDPFAEGSSRPMIKRFRKIKLNMLVEELIALHQQVLAVDSVEVSTAGIDLGLTSEETRLIQILGRRSRGTTVRIRTMTPGLSGSRTIHAIVVDSFGGQVANCVAKIGSRADLEEEVQRYESSVPLALAATCFAPISMVIADGVPRLLGLVYTFAAPDPRSLAQVLSENENASLGVLSRLRESESAWHAGGHTEQVTVSQACTLLSAPSPREVEFGLTEEETNRLCSMLVQVRKSPQHGDLHLGNVLVDAGGVPVLIDYGRTGWRIASYDPVTLELCLAFHPDGRVIVGEWPTLGQVERFDDLDFYVATCPCAEYVRACRSWAHDVANGDREVWLAVLGLALRQLRFPDTPHTVALAYAKRASELLLGGRGLRG